MVSAPLLVCGPSRSDPLSVLLVMRILKLNRDRREKKNPLLPTGSCRLSTAAGGWRRGAELLAPSPLCLRRIPGERQEPGRDGGRAGAEGRAEATEQMKPLCGISSQSQLTGSRRGLLRAVSSSWLPGMMAGGNLSLLQLV